MATTKAHARADWSLTPRGPVSGTAQGALALAAVAVAGDLATVHPLWGGAATVAGAVATVIRSAHLAHAPSGLLYRLGCWIGAGSWLTYTLAAGVWSQAAWMTLGLGALTAGIMSPLGRTAPRATSGTGAPGRALVLGRTARVGEEWERRILRVCRMRVQVTDVREWPTRTGYDVHLDLPGGGATRAQIESAADALAADARLPEGCGVEVAAGAHRGAVVLRVATVNRLGEDIAYPPVTTGASILDGVVIGEYRNGDPVRVPLRQESALVIGQTGSGKSILLNVLTGGAARCRDTIVWHIDLNGGSLSQIWLDPWLTGRSDRPAIDWAAGTTEEALEMAEAALRIAKDRKTSARKLKIQANTTLMPISADLPEIVIFLDEGAEAVSPGNRAVSALREALEEIQRIGRDAAVRLVSSSLRPTSDVLPPMIKKMSHVRIAMYVQDQSELGLMYEHNRAVKVEDLPGPGCGFVQLGQATPRPFKGQYMLPSDVVAAAVQIARVRPELDDRARALAGQAYATRYARMRAAFTDLDDLEDVDVQERLPATRPAAPVPATRSHLTSVPCGADANAWPDLRAMTKPAAPARASAADWPDLLPRQRPAGMLHAEQIRPVPSAPARPLPEILRRALAVFEQLRATRLHSGELAAALGILDAERVPDTTALAALLRPLGVERPAEAFLRQGQRGRGYERQHLEMAAERIRRGEIEVPAEVAAWPAA